jgi:hypothetical protein
MEMMTLFWRFERQRRRFPSLAPGRDGLILWHLSNYPSFPKSGPRIGNMKLRSSELHQARGRQPAKVSIEARVGGMRAPEVFA